MNLYSIASARIANGLPFENDLKFGFQTHSKEENLANYPPKNNKNQVNVK